MESPKSRPEKDEKVAVLKEHHTLSRREGESLFHHKLRLNQFIKQTQERIQDIRKQLPTLEDTHKFWHEEAERLEGLRKEPKVEFLPHTEKALWHAHERKAQHGSTKTWHENELYRLERNLEMYKQFRKSLDLQTRFARRDRPREK